MATGKLPISALLDSEFDAMERRLEQLSYRIRVAMPGIIQSFDEVKQTVSVKLAIRERLSIWGNPFEDIEIPTLLEVPVFMPRAGNFILTMPISPGDECLVVFTDNCYDSWWETGAVGNQMDNRRHDLSDGIAIVGIWSQPNKVDSYSTDSAVLRSLTGDCYIEVKESDVNIVAPTKVTVTGKEVNIDASESVVVNSPQATINADTAKITASVEASVEAPVATIEAATINLNGNVSAGGGANPVKIESSGPIEVTGGTVKLSGTTTIENKVFLAHTHSGVEPGGGNTGGVN